LGILPWSFEAAEMMHERGRESHHSIVMPQRITAQRTGNPAAIEMQVTGVILQPQGFPEIAIAAK
jgi:hypothetical protein